MTRNTISATSDAPMMALLIAVISSKMVGIVDLGSGRRLQRGASYGTPKTSASERRH